MKTKVERKEVLYFCMKSKDLKIHLDHHIQFLDKSIGYLLITLNEKCCTIAEKMMKATGHHKHVNVTVITDPLRRDQVGEFLRRPFTPWAMTKAEGDRECRQAMAQDPHKVLNPDETEGYTHVNDFCYCTLDDLPEEVSGNVEVLRHEEKYLWLVLTQAAYDIVTTKLKTLGWNDHVKVLIKPKNPGT